MNKKHQKLLDWIDKSETGVVLESQIVGSGLSPALNDLIMSGDLEMIEHPTVKERGGYPAAGVRRIKKPS